ncbi:MAG: carboxypeptidase-like regulatory domain-containing protein [Patescibacteria group bacterium]
MYRVLNIRISLLVISYLLLVAPPALAQNLSSQILSLSIVNPDGPMSNVKVIFDIPAGFVPGDLGDSAIWDSVNRQITVNLGFFAPGETKPVNITLTAPPGVYTINGRTSGFWQEVAQPFSSNLKPVVLVFQAPASSFGSLPKQLESIPEAAREGTFVDDLVKQITANQEVLRITETISLPVAAGLGVVGVVSALSSAYATSASFASSISKILSYLSFGFLRLRRRKPWGRVVNNLTGRPIEGAVVKILDNDFRKVKETQVTDKDGRFGFLVTPGSYLIQVNRGGFGEKETSVFQVADIKYSPNLEIPLEALHVGLADYALRTARIWHWLNLFLDRLSPFTITIGTVASILSVLLNPNLLNYTILALYAFLILLMTVVKSVAVRSFGRVLERSTDGPIPLAVVRLYDVKQNWLIGTHVTDDSGRFNFLVNPGEYYVTAVKNNFTPFTSQPSHFSKANLLNFDIKLDVAK